jgi:antitoxin component YwqK of YwqJK toxin-antitoxin module
MSYHPEDTQYTDVIYEKEGVYTTHYTNRAIKTLQSYKSGKLHGICLTYDLYGNILTESLFHENMIQKYIKIYYTPMLHNEYYSKDID